MGEFSAVWYNAELLKLGPRFRGEGFGGVEAPVKAPAAVAPPHRQLSVPCGGVGALTVPGGLCSCG